MGRPGISAQHNPESNKVIRIMFKQILPLGLILSAATMLHAGQAFEISASWEAPLEKEEWKNGTGAEAALIFRGETAIGLGLTLGISRWSSEAFGQQTYNDRYGQAAMFHSAGDASLLPLGASMVFTPKIEGRFRVGFEAGLRYVIVNSNVDASLTYVEDEIELVPEGVLQEPSVEVGANVAVVNKKVEIDDGLVAILGGAFYYDLSESAALFAGLRYQFDLHRGDISWAGTDLGENELAAVMARVGLGATF
jgi:hypothetical protein